MDAERLLRIATWLLAGAGVFAAFGWPFVVSSDPDDPVLRVLARTDTALLLLVLAGAAVLRASRGR
jgi:hypothetical protein